MSFVSIPYFGHLSDGIGRKKMSIIDGHLNTCRFRRAVAPAFAIADRAPGRDWDHPDHHHAADLSGQAALPAGKREDLMILVKSRDYRN